VVRSAPIGRVACFLLTLAALGACDGKTIHLGDGRADGAACSRGQVNADEVLWIGDSWILVPGSQYTQVRDTARRAGAIGPTDDYVNGAAAASSMSAVANQYATREAGATKAKVVILDGGTWDTIVANGAGTSVPNAATAAAATFANLLAQMAADGTVEDVIYFLVPDIATIPGVSTLGPLVKQSCAESAVHCHFIDLGPLWTSAYTDSALGFLPNDAGARVLADQIWAVMQASCIAQ
jgi:hypothetical protein